MAHQKKVLSILILMFLVVDATRVTLDDKLNHVSKAEEEYTTVEELYANGGDGRKANKLKKEKKKNEKKSKKEKNGKTDEDAGVTTPEELYAGVVDGEAPMEEKKGGVDQPIVGGGATPVEEHKGGVEQINVGGGAGAGVGARAGGAVVELPPKGDLEMNGLGFWEIINQNAGVSAMHVILLPTNKIMIIDARVYHTSRIKFPPGVPCPTYVDDTKKILEDCFAHSVEYDIETNQVRPLKLDKGDPWCSCGGLAPDGSLIGVGGFSEGEHTTRYYGGACQDCQWREFDNTLVDRRWYASQQILPNGEFIVVGGRRSFSYEIVPKEAQTSLKAYQFPFLFETTDVDENNLYPFVHLSIDGNLFIFANNRSILLNPTTHNIVRTFPVLPGGSRNYPASGTSALLPLDLSATILKPEVMICGGNTPYAFFMAEDKKIFEPALQDCNRLFITEENPNWDTEQMPSRRVMGDNLILPNGEILFVNGAQAGTSAWTDADQPNYTPALYSPNKPKGQRFRELKPTQIARMYHSTSAVLPSGKIWISGSNTHPTYVDNDKYPTETRVEAFNPPYLDQKFDRYRPKIEEIASAKELKYGGKFDTLFTVDDGVALGDIKVTMYYPPFTTHGVSMGQRLLVLKKDGMVEQGPKSYKVTLEAPQSSNVAPPGYYLLFVVNRGVPGKGMWVHIQ